MASKPVQRSLKHLRKQGWTCTVVERWKPVFDKKTGTLRPYGVRVDAFGFGDILACNPDEVLKGEECGIALIQATDATSFAKHLLKILPLPELQKWKDAGGRAILHGWGKRGERGKRKVWTLREEIL